MSVKAVFLDRDGVINKMVYHGDHGILDSPFTPEQFCLMPDIPEAIQKFRSMGFKVVVVSNQPGMAKGNISRETFEKIDRHMHAELTSKGAEIDGAYYCFHHPDAVIDGLKINCACRKPKPGLLLQAASDLDIDLRNSWMIGDGLTDVQAGKAAGCRTILVGRIKCELCLLMDENDARPRTVCASLLHACETIKNTVSSWRSP